MNSKYLHTIMKCYPIGCVESFSSFELFYADERLQVFCAKGFWIRTDFLHEIRDHSYRRQPKNK